MKKHRSTLLWFNDKWIFFTLLAILLFGLLMVSSASMVISDKQFGYPFHYLVRQACYILVGFIVAWVVMQLPIKFWQKASGYLMFLGVILLIAVLIPGIGKVVNGSRRWIHLGVISLQVTELVKLFSIIYLANYLVRFKQQIQTQWIGSIKPMVILGVMALLLLFEPDFGTFVVITMTFLALLFIADVKLWPFILLFVIVAVAVTVLALISPYRLLRLTTFLNPWEKQFGAGYQLTQSLIAFGRGGVFGVGLGNSVQKLFYLPEAHTDFIFAVVGEELGLMGELLVLALYAVLIIRIFILAKRANGVGHPYASYLAYGIGFWLCFQALINIGVSVGVLPTKGLTLPFLSYGGSSLIVNCLAIALIFRISHEIDERPVALQPRGYS
jgi:cell division protein FtsW